MEAAVRIGEREAKVAHKLVDGLSSMVFFYNEEKSQLVR